MAQVARKCTKCGSLDTQRTWSSTAAAVDDGALEAWTCPSCAWPEAELVDTDAEATGA